MSTFFPLLRRPFLVLGESSSCTGLGLGCSAATAVLFPLCGTIHFPASFGNGGVLRATHQQETFASSPIVCGSGRAVGNPPGLGSGASAVGSRRWGRDFRAGVPPRWNADLTPDPFASRSIGGFWSR
ncbi:hypothetical protein B0J15DRAFT_481351 [Fusarium solani]|uniref:Uncharacterized protein n=1 Tax=Fusarium solani TaxID=169388 RepID=A0A9P9L137_FUSSL|nr:uncharacterized protein B0J15DRAFT_481351 [Fusarium solani]KAH7272278.1 hypothetical protein B0J15DRAFT_481351 [Fusarium solani]